MVKNVALGKELVVGVKNKIGVLADIAKLMAEHGINVEAVAGYAMDAEARIMLVTSDNLRASDALKKKGYTDIKEKEVVLVDLENKPGALKGITTKIAQDKVDIKYVYGTTCPSGCPARMVISTTDNEKTVVLLKK